MAVTATSEPEAAAVAQQCQRWGLGLDLHHAARGRLGGVTSPHLWAPGWVHCGPAARSAFVLLLTPTGSPPSPRWRWWVWLTAAAPLLYILAEALERSPMDPPFGSVVSPMALSLGEPAETVLRVIDWIAALLTQVAILAGAGSLIVRFRRARGVERLQLRWVALAAILAGVAALGVAAGTVTGIEALWLWSSYSYIVVLPLAVGASVLRYRLYDLDRIISRTSYLDVPDRVPALGRRGPCCCSAGCSPRAPALAAPGTLVVSPSSSRPACRISRSGRRRNRHRYDAARTIQAFSGRLRQHLDLTACRPKLLADRPDDAAHHHVRCGCARP
jgi:hypothetical protein